ncbi:MAG: hypothetical protein M3377_06845, partial [Actinomycetota bacterium]|nr:hypothetical protein [Actinomycetota bacterium]
KKPRGRDGLENERRVYPSSQFEFPSPWVTATLTRGAGSRIHPEAAAPGSGGLPAVYVVAGVRFLRRSSSITAGAFARTARH